LKEISILGCGWFGLPLAKRLVEKGYLVEGSTTTSEKLELLRNEGIEPYHIDFGIEEQHTDVSFFNSDILVVAIPPKRRAGESHAYPQKIESICRLAAKGQIQHLIFVSSTGVYPNTNRSFDESDLPEPDTESGKSLLQAEHIVKSYTDYTTTIVRFGGLYGGDRNPARFFGNKSDIPNGLAPVNLIHRDDCLGISESILDRKAFGHTYNACSPEHPSRSDFYRRAAETIGLESPTFINELLNWKKIESVNIPRYLNYTYKVSLF